MSMKNKFENWFYLDEEEDEVETPQSRQREETRPVKEQPKKVNSRKQTFSEPSQSATVVSLQSAQKSSKVVLSRTACLCGSTRYF